MPHPSTELFGETRGEIVRLLRAQPRTVNDLAAALQLTDNAIRAHLAELQNAGLITQSGERPGTRKPHSLYALTPKAQELLSGLYAPVLKTLLELLKEGHSPAQVETLVKNIGHRLAEPHAAEFARRPLDRRIDQALQLLGTFGGSATAEKNKGSWVIQGQGCPLASAVSANPQVCALLQTLLADLLGRPVREQCTKGASPHCCFAVTD